MSGFATLTLRDCFELPFPCSLPDCDGSDSAYYNPIAQVRISPPMKEVKASAILFTHELRHSDLDRSRYMCFVRGCGRMLHVSLCDMLSQPDVDRARQFLEDPGFKGLNEQVSDLIRRARVIQELYAIWHGFDTLQHMEAVTALEAARIRDLLLWAYENKHPEDNLSELFARYDTVHRSFGGDGTFPFEYALNGRPPTPWDLAQDAKRDTAQVRVDPGARFAQALYVMETVSSDVKFLPVHLDFLTDLREFFRLVPDGGSYKWEGEFEPCFGKSREGPCEVDESFGAPAGLEGCLRKVSRESCRYRARMVRGDIRDDDVVDLRPEIEVIGDTIYVSPRCAEQYRVLDRVFFESLRQQLVHEMGLTCPFAGHHKDCCPYRRQLAMAWLATCDRASSSWQRPACFNGRSDSELLDLPPGSDSRWTPRVVVSTSQGPMPVQVGSPDMSEP